MEDIQIVNFDENLPKKKKKKDKTKKKSKLGKTLTHYQNSFDFNCVM